MSQTQTLKILFQGVAAPTVVEHGTELVGANPHSVALEDLCKVPCAWCRDLVKRIKSRGGIVSMGPLQ